MSIVLTNLSFGYDPLGEPLLRDVNLTLSSPRTGIVGRNGSGKSTLLKLIAGELSPTKGSLAVDRSVSRLRQDLLQAGDHSVASILGIDEQLAALRRIEAGSVEQTDFDTVGDDWDVEARALGVVAQRVPSLSLDEVLTRPAATLSGGELVQLAIAALDLAGAQVALLDEPTNNLDSRSRDALYGAVEGWNGQLIVVSHDVTLLNLMDATVELHDGAAQLHGGHFDFYVAQREAVQAATRRKLRDAEGQLRDERKDLQHVQQATARQARHDKQRFASTSGGPRKSDPTAKRAAEARRASRVKAAAASVREARERVVDAESDVRDDESIRIPIIDPAVARGRVLASLVGANRTLTLGGGDRWALVGDNGVGKTTLLRQTMHDAVSRSVGFLDQRLELSPGTVFDAVAGVAPGRLPHDTHELLAKFLIKGDMVHRDVDTLSGGERFRVALARVLLADPPPELLVLDEPTNNLDLDSVEQLVEALTRYRGALLIVSHDANLLARLALDRTVELTEGGVLT